MSDLSEKLATVRASDGRARATLDQIRRMWGVEAEATTGEAPQEVTVRVMGRVQRWRLVSGRGASAVYELRREA